MSVGDKDVKIKAMISSILFKGEIDPVINQIATPDIAIIKVGDSAL